MSHWDRKSDLPQIKSIRGVNSAYSLQYYMSSGFFRSVALTSASISAAPSIDHCIWPCGLRTKVENSTARVLIGGHGAYIHRYVCIYKLRVHHTRHLHFSAVRAVESMVIDKTRTANLSASCNESSSCHRSISTALTTLRTCACMCVHSGSTHLVLALEDGGGSLVSRTNRSRFPAAVIAARIWLVELVAVVRVPARVDECHAVGAQTCATQLVSPWYHARTHSSCSVYCICIVYECVCFVYCTTHLRTACSPASSHTLCAPSPPRDLALGTWMCSAVLLDARSWRVYWHQR